MAKKTSRRGRGRGRGRTQRRGRARSQRGGLNRPHWSPYTFL